MELDFTRAERKPSAISLIPLINVIFLLLTFFMIAGSFEKNTPAMVTLPEARNGKVLESGELELVLTSDNRIIFAGDEVPPKALQALVAAKLEEQPNTILTLKADANLQARDMIDVLDVIKKAGGVNVSLVTQGK